MYSGQFILNPTSSPRSEITHTHPDLSDVVKWAFSIYPLVFQPVFQPKRQWHLGNAVYSSPRHPRVLVPSPLLMKKPETFLTTTFRAQTTVIWKENFWHFFWRSIWQIFCLAVQVRQGTLAADGRGWGPAGNNGPRMIAVGVRQETLAADDRGSGPVANTSGWSRWRSGREHWAQMGAVEEATRRRTRRTRRRWGWHKMQQPSPLTWQLGILFWGVPKNLFLNEKLFGSREDMPDRMSGDAQKMSDKMSEEMPERMLEDFLQSVCEIESNCNQHSLINPKYRAL